MRSPDEMRADAERALRDTDYDKPLREEQRTRTLAYHVLSLLAERAWHCKAKRRRAQEIGRGRRLGPGRRRAQEIGALEEAAMGDRFYAHGKRAGLISAAEYLEHEAVLAKGDLRTGLYNSAALVCRSRAAVAAPEAPAAQGEHWQPIETAPKDDTIFLVYGEGRTFVAKGSIMWHGRRVDTPQHLSMAYLTHWMPLPKSPISLPAPPKGGGA